MSVLDSLGFMLKIKDPHGTISSERSAHLDSSSLCIVQGRHNRLPSRQRVRGCTGRERGLMFLLGRYS